MKPDINDALVALKPGAIWTLPNNPTATNDYERLVWQDESQTKPTEDEVNVKVTELVNAYPMKLLRVERTRILSKSDWMANSDVAMSDAWKTYRQELRDMTKTLSDDDLAKIAANSKEIEWPTEPS